MDTTCKAGKIVRYVLRWKWTHILVEYENLRTHRILILKVIGSIWTVDDTSVETDIRPGPGARLLVKSLLHTQDVSKVMYMCTGKWSCM
jgi:hypothetical protein